VRAEAGGKSILSGLYGWKRGLFHNSRHAIDGHAVCGS
jgi:hypothetical protein